MLTFYRKNLRTQIVIEQGHTQTKRKKKVTYPTPGLAPIIIELRCGGWVSIGNVNRMRWTRFVAGILQGMFFSADRPNYMNYGGIGYVIGHEITHGFDDQGRMYDKRGNMRNWWRRETSEKFTERALCMVRQYNGFEVAGWHVNGLHTLDENIADNGGVMLAYHAYRRWSAAHGDPEPRLPGLDRYTPRQMFWISAANVWCSVYRPEMLRQFLLTGQHSPGRYRVIGSFQNQRDFAADFQCPAGSYMNPAKKCKVW